jgi:hypothetical protein
MKHPIQSINLVHADSRLSSRDHGGLPLFQCNLFTERPGYRLSVHENIDVISLVKSFVDKNPYRLSIELLVPTVGIVHFRATVLLLSFNAFNCRPWCAVSFIDCRWTSCFGVVLFVFFAFMLIGGMLDMLSAYRLSVCRALIFLQGHHHAVEDA